MSNYAPENLTITVNDAYAFDPTLFENCYITDDTTTEKFKSVFLGQWGLYGIAGETVALFKQMITLRFQSRVSYYQDLLKWQDTDVGIIQTETFNTTDTVYELPNKTNPQRYPTAVATHEETRRRDNQLEHKAQARRLIENVMLDFVMEFNDCMCLVYA